MAVKVQLKRGLKANVAGLTMSAGELVFATDTKELYVSDGSSKSLVGRAIVDTFTNRPAASTAGRIFLASDTSTAYIDTGSVWVALGGGGMAWSVITGNTTATSDNGYGIDASSNAVTLTLPGTPAVGTQVAFRVLDKTNTVTIARVGSYIEGVASDLVLDIAGSGGLLVDLGATKGWVNVTEIGRVEGGGTQSDIWLYARSN